MIELRGKYNECKIFTDNADSATIGQLTALLNQESVQGNKIRIMADCHAGAGCVIGTTMTIENKKVIPNLVGVDLGCGMYCTRLKEKRINLPEFDSAINKNIPSGFNIRKSRHKYVRDLKLEDLYAYKYNGVNIDRAALSLGSLGGGNHFIELDKDLDKDEETGDVYLVIHTGSRYLGKQIAEYYQDKAWDKIKNGGLKQQIDTRIKELKKQGKNRDIQLEITRLKQEASEKGELKVPHELAYCEGELFEMYMHDMKIAQDYAHWNRRAILDTILDKCKLHEEESFETIHNYIEISDNGYMLRKGSVSAKEGERLLIPINMRDGSLICIGKGNPDYNYSAPHGAGRLMSRSQAKQSFTVSEFKKTMKEAGIYSTSVGQSTLDECPMAYKPMEEILKNIEDTVVVEKIIKPIYNFKASGD